MTPVGDRPILIGMNNPHSEDPRHALAPYPSGVAGHRLWRMLSDRCGASRLSYMRAFERINLLNSRTWSPLRARAQNENLWSSLRGRRRVVVLGNAVKDVLWLSRVPYLRWTVTDDVRWCLLPHPSGLCRLYNDELVRVAVGMRLEELYVQATQDVSCVDADLSPIPELCCVSNGAGHSETWEAAA